MHVCLLRHSPSLHPLLNAFVCARLLRQLLTRERRTASCRATSFCSLWSLSRSDLNNVLVDFPDMKERMEKSAHERLMRSMKTEAKTRQSIRRMSIVATSLERGKQRRCSAPDCMGIDLAQLGHQAAENDGAVCDEDTINQAESKASQFYFAVQRAMGNMAAMQQARKEAEQGTQCAAGESSRKAKSDESPDGSCSPNILRRQGSNNNHGFWTAAAASAGAAAAGVSRRMRRKSGEQPQCSPEGLRPNSPLTPPQLTPSQYAVMVSSEASLRENSSQSVGKSGRDRSSRLSKESTASAPCEDGSHTQAKSDNRDGRRPSGSAQGESRCARLLRRSKEGFSSASKHIAGPGGSLMSMGVASDKGSKTKAVTSQSDGHATPFDGRGRPRRRFSAPDVLAVGCGSFASPISRSASPLSTLAEAPQRGAGAISPSLPTTNAEPPSHSQGNSPSTSSPCRSPALAPDRRPSHGSVELSRTCRSLMTGAVTATCIQEHVEANRQAAAAAAAANSPPMTRPPTRPPPLSLASTQPSNALTNALTARDLDELPTSHLLQLERLLQELAPLVHSAVAKQRNSAGSSVVDAHTCGHGNGAATVPRSEDKEATTGVVVVEKVSDHEREGDHNRATDNVPPPPVRPPPPTRVGEEH